MAPQELTIHDLLNSGKYVIPLYQRNYAWGEVEITQLLQDVWDKYKTSNESNYYIGTLVIDKRKADVYEIIDGQQRHTTVTLINAVIHGNKEYYNSAIPISNLTFDARDDIKQFIDMLLSNYKYAKEFSTESIGLSNIKRAIRYIEGFFEKDEVKKEIPQYLKYFYHNIKIVRIDVPEDTDINHYFEIMNNRGEQLEQHEILKAKFIDNFEKDKEELHDKFAIIWDACSQMDRPIQSCFNTSEREILFGKDFTDIPSDGISKNFRISDGQINAKNESVLVDILNSELNHNFQQIEQESRESRYKSIIDFPNFLLQVLKITATDNNVSLDDKNLLKAFNYPNKADMPSPESFINSLLYYRTLFDRYIIKREEANDDWNWKLISPVRYQADVSYKNTFGIDDDEGVESKDFVMLQSMLHVSFPGNSYKYWLQEVLNFLGKELEINKHTFFAMLSAIASTEFSNIKASQYNLGTHTPRYLFNYLDYILWNEYDKNVRGKDKGNLSEIQRKMLKVKDKFNSFRFTQNNSVEHVAPQNPIDGSPAVRQLNSFGNLCLISSSTNSRLINLGFDGKKEYFKSTKSVESLKQTLIFSHAKWDDSEIDEHHKEVLSLLESYNYETVNLTTNISVSNETEVNQFFVESKIDSKELTNDEILVNLKNKLIDISAELEVNIDFDEPDSLLGKKDTGFWLYKDEWKYCIYFYFRGNNKDMYVSVDDRSYANRCDKELALKIRLGFEGFFVEQNDIQDVSKMWSERFPIWDNTSWSEVLSVIPFQVAEWGKKILGKISELKLENV